MIHELYSALAYKLRTEVPEIAGPGQVDWYLKQYTLEDPRDGALFATPALFIEFAPMRWVTKGASNMQEASVTFITHLVTESHYEDEQRVLTDAHYALEQSVFKALQGCRVLRSNIVGQAHLLGTPQDMLIAETITRTGQDTDHELSRILVSRTEWHTKVYDYRAMPQYITTTVSPDISVAIE